MDSVGSARLRPRPPLHGGRRPAGGPSPSSEEPPNRLLDLLDAYRRDPASLPQDTSRLIRSQLESLERRLDQGEGLSFSEARFIDRETVCLVFTGLSGEEPSLPPQVNLLVDQQWNISGGIRFQGLFAEPLRP